MTKEATWRTKNMKIANLSVHLQHYAEGAYAMFKSSTNGEDKPSLGKIIGRGECVIQSCLAQLMHAEPARKLETSDKSLKKLRRSMNLGGSKGWLRC